MKIFSVLWLSFMIISALTVDYLPLPPADVMDYDHLQVLPGSWGELLDETRENQLPHLFVLGSDGLGRDILTRLLFGTRISLLVGILSPMIALIIGTGLGMIAGTSDSGKSEKIILLFATIGLAFPSLVFLMFVKTFFGSSLTSIVVSIGLIFVPGYTRFARAETLSYRNLDFVTAAQTAGAGRLDILIREILPNIIRPMVVLTLLVSGSCIAIEGGLSFLGLSLPPPVPSWGNMIAEGQHLLDEAPHITLIPAGFLSLTVLSLNFLRDDIQREIDGKDSNFL